MFVVPENRRISQELLVPPGDGGQAPKPGRSSSPKSSRSPHATRSRSRASSKCSATTPTPAWKSRSRCASTICRTSFAPAVKKASARFDGKVSDADIAGREDVRELPLVTIDGETARDFDDAVYCEPRGEGLSPARRDRRRQPLCGTWRCARSRGAQARQLGVFPAARHSHAAGSAVERAVLAQSARRPPVHGVRHEHRRARRGRRLSFLSGGHVVARAVHLYRGRRYSRESAGCGGRRAPRAGAAADESLPALPGARQVARQARRDRFRDDRDRR